MLVNFHDKYKISTHYDNKTSVIKIIIKKLKNKNKKQLLYVKR